MKIGDPVEVAGGERPSHGGGPSRSAEGDDPAAIIDWLLKGNRPAAQR